MGGAVMGVKADFAGHLTAYLGRWLPGQRNLSPNTIASYRDAFRLLIAFFRERGKEPEGLSMDDLGRDGVLLFMEWLEARGCSDSTLNQRLCAIKAFVGYAKCEDPARLLQYQQVLAIPQRRHAAPKMPLPGKEGMAAILRHPDPATRKGRRDRALLSLLYDSGARVSELCGIELRDLRLESPAAVTLRGKGRKARAVPLMGQTVGMLEGYLAEFWPGFGTQDLDSPLFPNPRGGRLTRAGIADIVSRHAAGAREAGTPIPDGISPHSFRHQKAVDLLEAGVPLVYIRDVLGHASVATTEIYAKVSLERKRELLEKAASSPAPAAEGYPDWTADSDLMSWLAGLC